MSDRDPKRATVALNPRQLSQLRRRMRHIAGLLEQGATSENARPYYNAELSALRQVVDAFDPPKGEMCGTGDETCWTSVERITIGYLGGTCTADAAEEGTT